MKRFLFIFNIIFILYIKVSAQHIISVIDDATREPIWHASFIYKSDTIAYTSPQGIALVPNKTGLIRIICNDYKSIEFDCDSIPSVVHLKSEVVKIDEIEVIGDRNKYKRKFPIPKNMELEYTLKEARPNGGHSSLIPGTNLYKLIGYEPKSIRKRRKTKEILNAYDKIPQKE